jgi:hypothetical protein
MAPLVRISKAKPIATDKYQGQNNLNFPVGDLVQNLYVQPEIYC